MEGKRAEQSSVESASGECPPSFENSLEQLEAIVHALEDGEHGLAESLEQYECGVKHLKHCYQLLQAAERKIELLTAVDQAGNPVTAPFGDEARPLEDQAGNRRRRRAASPPPATVEPDDADDMDAAPGLF